jgi:hypothetical protein
MKELARRLAPATLRTRQPGAQPPLPPSCGPPLTLPSWPQLPASHRRRLIAVLSTLVQRVRPRREENNDCALSSASLS